MVSLRGLEVSFCFVSSSLLSLSSAPHLLPCCSQKAPASLSDHLMQGDEPQEMEEPAKKGSKKGRKGKKDRSKKKKKRDRSSKKGKKRESRKKRKEMETLEEEEGFLQVSTVMPDYLSLDPFRTTPLPVFEQSTPAMALAEDTPELGGLIPEMPTHEPESNLEDPTVVSTTLPESKVEVDKTNKVSMFPQRHLPSLPFCFTQLMPPNTHPCRLHLDLHPSRTNQYILQGTMGYMESVGRL